MALSSFYKPSLLPLGCLTVIAALAIAPAADSSDEGDPYQVSSLEITILSTMLAEEGVGEWGFAAIIEADGHRILFDTGRGITHGELQSLGHQVLD